MGQKGKLSIFNQRKCPVNKYGLS